MTLVKDANTNELNEITSSYLEEFQDEETRHIYVDEFLHTKIATQIKALREQRGWTQGELAERAGMKQERICVLEDVNYSAWTLNVLRRLAKAFDLRINLTFEDFGSFLAEFAGFDRKSLERTSFSDDPIFKKVKKPKAKVLDFPLGLTEPVRQSKTGHYTLNYLTAVAKVKTTNDTTSNTAVSISPRLENESETYKSIAMAG